MANVSASSPDSGSGVVVPAANMSDWLPKYENSNLNKTECEIILCKIRLFEKKKIPYRIKVSEVHNADKKTVKRGKKNNHNNKYILFNSWYNSNKDRRECVLSSHDMWNYIKTHSSAAQLFIGMFDYMEKLGKSIDVSTISTEAAAAAAPSTNDATPNNGGGGGAGEESGRKKRGAAELTDDAKRLNKRSGLYEEFYKVLTFALKTGSAPAASCVYDLRINNTHGIDKLNKNVVQNGMDAFKEMIDKLEIDQKKNQHQQTPTTTPPPAPTAAAATKASRKRKAPASSHAKIKQSRKVVAAVEATSPIYDNYNMVSDVGEDSQMSD
uniref:Pp31 n=1 Tax=Lymantria dispar multicapsid nuclear polyhedrosis virus TaxID=10449 RepID=A0A1B1MQR2_NPVLD|nr:pp31 [Lymantria dispar multiple nucleopolyhedrovirus]